MSLDWKSIDRSSRLVDAYFFYPFYNKLNGVAREYPSVFWAAPVIGVVDGIAGFVQVICCVAEAALKGVGNMFSGIAGERVEWKRGVLQLVFGVGFVGLLAIPVIVMRILWITGDFASNPQKTCETQAENYRKKIQMITWI